VPAPAIARNTTPRALGAALAGRRLGPPNRHGKWMVAPAGGPALALHFGMTGFLRFCADAAEPRHRHDRLILVLDGGELRYRNMRMLGGVWLLGPGEELEEVAGPLGPDAAAVGREELDAILDASRGELKALLMNQRRIAGIGNELSDEVLWRARVHPRRRSASLRLQERARLHRALIETIATSNRHWRIPTGRGWLKSQRGWRDPRCPRCGARVRRATVAGRTAYWCPRCQRG
jgi:formamidopyrimidine-DNA glycosylase